MEEFSLGLESELKQLPKEIVIERKFYYLLKLEEGYRLVSRVCPHAGALLEVEDGELVCFMHGWSFDIHTGACLNIPNKDLPAYPVTIRGGELFVQI